MRKRDPTTGDKIKQKKKSIGIEEPTPKLLVMDKPAIPLIENIGAPFLYFDACPNFGLNDGVGNVTLEALRFSAHDSTVLRERIQVAHLRMSLAAVRSLKAALENIILMSQPPSGSAD